MKKRLGATVLAVAAFLSVEQAQAAFNEGEYYKTHLWGTMGETGGIVTKITDETPEGLMSYLMHSNYQNTPGETRASCFLAYKSDELFDNNTLFRTEIEAIATDALFGPNGTITDCCYALKNGEVYEIKFRTASFEWDNRDFAEGQCSIFQTHGVPELFDNGNPNWDLYPGRNPLTISVYANPQQNGGKSYYMFNYNDPSITPEDSGAYGPIEELSDVEVTPEWASWRIVLKPSTVEDGFAVVYLNGAKVFEKYGANADSLVNAEITGFMPRTMAPFHALKLGVYGYYTTKGRHIFYDGLSVSLFTKKNLSPVGNPVEINVQINGENMKKVACKIFQEIKPGVVERPLWFRVGEHGLGKILYNNGESNVLTQGWMAEGALQEGDKVVIKFVKGSSRAFAKYDLKALNSGSGGYVLQMDSAGYQWAAYQGKK